MSETPETPDEGPVPEDVGPDSGQTGKRGRKAPGPPPDVSRGISVIQDQVRRLPSGPGVYRMLDHAGDVLYVGKARNLKRRVTNYAHPAKLSHRIFRMVSETHAMEVVTTHTEVEALLLESNLIKRLKPRFNVLLRDDKSFPFILIIGDHEWPQIVKHRGARSRKGDYFGPFASAGAVNRTITALQRAFQVRNCSDSIFASRTRPCLQFQIKRCTAPCVGLVSEEGYADQVASAKAFLGGRSKDVQERFASAMQTAAEGLDFETAAIYRDRIRALTAIQAHQDINVEGVEDADVIGLSSEGGTTCVQVFFFRGGSNYGNRAYFPSHDKAEDEATVLGAFIGQFYDDKTPPRSVLISHDIPDMDLVAEALSVRAERRVEFLRPQRGAKRKIVDHVIDNARDALARRLAESASQRKLLEGVSAVFGLDGPPQRIEVYDNSHIQGTNAIGAMIVAGPEGFRKAAYRKFNIRETQGPSARGDEGEGAETQQIAGDDYAMMRQVLERRFGRALKEDPNNLTGSWPDLVIIDGGAGQLSATEEVFAGLGIEDVPFVAIAKGPDRDAGRERFFMPGRAPFSLEPRDPVLYFLQRLRDEAHRFAIETHRGRRQKAMGTSPLDEVAGIGAKRKKALLLHFGSARGVARAGLEDLEAVDGISKTVARKIYDHFHADG